jgi:hypothetical protein
MQNSYALREEWSEDYKVFAMIKMFKVKKYLNNYVRTSFIYGSKILVVRFGKKNTFQDRGKLDCGIIF